MDEFVFLSWQSGNTWNLNFNFKFQVFPDCQDRKTNSSVRFLGKVTTWKFFSRSTDPQKSNTFSISSARKFFLADKIIIFIGRKADVQVYHNPPNFTNYKIQSIIVSILIVGVGMEILEILPLVSLQEAFIGSIWQKNISLIMIRYNFG